MAYEKYDGDDRLDHKDLFDPPGPLEELDVNPGDPTRPPLRGHWLGGRKPTPEETARALVGLDELRGRAKRGPESIQELRDEGRRH